MRDDYWFSPVNLIKADRDSELAAPESLVKGGDFASYAKVNRGAGLENSGIESQNLISSSSRVRSYYELVGRKRFKKIADLGCGLGFTSAVLAEVFGTKSVTGYEVFSDPSNMEKNDGQTLVL